MGMLARILGRDRQKELSANEALISKRSAPSSWDLMRGDAWPTDAGSFVSPALAENLSAVYAATQIISETIASLPVHVYRTSSDGSKNLAPNHPVARLFSREPNAWQTTMEFVEMMSAHCLLRGNAFAEIKFNSAGAPVELIPMSPDLVSVVRFPGSRRVAFDFSDPFANRTRRLLAEEVLHLRDRSDDGVVGKSRLARARETFGTAIATERFAASTWRNGASLSGVLSHPDAIGRDAADNIRRSFEENYTGSQNAKRVLVLEEGLRWTPTSVSMEDAQLLESRKFSVESIARLFRVPLPILGDLSNGNYSNVVELNRMFAQHCIMPWLTRWERCIERALFSDEGRRNHEVEFDADVLMRGDMLARYQSYRIAREIGMLSANEIRKFENLNPRADAGGGEYLSPLNMMPEQAGESKEAAA